MTTPQSPRPALTVCSPRKRTCCFYAGLNPNCCLQKHQGWECSRIKDHDGPHIACEGLGIDDDHNLATWPNASQPTPTEGKEGEPECETTNAAPVVRDKCAETHTAQSTDGATVSSDAATQGASSLGAAGGEQGFPAEFLADIKKANIAIATQRNEDPNFKPSLSFLQRRMRWGFARASMVLPYVNTRTPDPAPTAARDAGVETAIPTKCAPCDWPEDFSHENGNYQNRCSCGIMFIGHKRRVTCKVCATPPPSAPVAREETATPEVDAELQNPCNCRSPHVRSSFARSLECQRDEARNALTNNLWSEWEIERAKTKVELETARAEVARLKKCVREEWDSVAADKILTNAEQLQDEISRLAGELESEKALCDAIAGEKQKLNAALAAATARTEALEKAMQSIHDVLYSGDYKTEVDRSLQIAGITHAILATRPATRATGEHGPDTQPS